MQRYAAFNYFCPSWIECLFRLVILHHTNKILTDGLMNDVSIYRTSDDIGSFNIALHALQNGAGHIDASSNHGLDSVDIKRLVGKGGCKDQGDPPHVGWLGVAILLFTFV